MLPLAVRRRCGLGAGEQVLVAADPNHDVPCRAPGGGSAGAPSAVTQATEDRLALATFVLLCGSALLPAIVEQHPYVATMSPQVLWWSLALGADGGGKATAIGATANSSCLGLAARAGKPVSFWQFTRYGLVVTVLTVELSVPYLRLRYFGLAWFGADGG